MRQRLQVHSIPTLVKTRRQNYEQSQYTSIQYRRRCPHQAKTRRSFRRFLYTRVRCDLSLCYYRTHLGYDRDGFQNVVRCHYIPSDIRRSRSRIPTFYPTVLKTFALAVVPWKPVCHRDSNRDGYWSRTARYL